MFQHYFELIDGVEVYPIISLLVFLFFFIMILIWFFRADKKYLKEMEELPLESKTEI
jgi:cytochrome c oxidase cbb3-type subunit 4